MTNNDNPTSSGANAHKSQASETNQQAEKCGQFGPIIFTYSRKDALADGVQFNVSRLAYEVGFKIPVFITDSVQALCVSVPEGVEGQDETGRLWDVLWMLKCAIALRGGKSDRVDYTLLVRNNNTTANEVNLVAVCSALDVDDASPSITIMLPHED